MKSRVNRLYTSFQNKIKQCNVEKEFTTFEISIIDHFLEESLRKKGYSFSVRFGIFWKLPFTH